MLVRDNGIETQEGCIPGLRGVPRNLKRSSMVRCQNWHLHFSVLSVLEIARHVGVPLRVALHATFEPVRLTIGHAADQEAVDSISRTRLSNTFAARIEKAGERRSRYQDAFHHAGTTMIASPRNTARRARSANISGAIGRVRSQNLRISSSLTPVILVRPYWPPVRIGVRITPDRAPRPARRGARPRPATSWRLRRRRVWWRCSLPGPQW